MARKPSEMKELAARVEAPEAGVRTLREVLTPEAQLRLLLQRTRAKAKRVPTSTMNRAIDQAAREVRRERATRAAR